MITAEDCCPGRGASRWEYRVEKYPLKNLLSMVFGLFLHSQKRGLFFIDDQGDKTAGSGLVTTE
jgi:hypothetical protein